MINQPDIPTSSSSSSSAATSISSSLTSSSFATSAFVEPVDPSNDVIRLPRSVHQRLLQELSAGKTKLRAMDNLQKLFREKVDELERTRERLENCQRALLRCERRLCDVMARQSVYFRSFESVSNISGINNNSSPNGRQGCAEAECGGVKGSETNKAMGTDASKNTETETTSLEKPGLDHSYLLRLADVSRNELLQLSEKVGSGLAVADVDDEASVQQMTMIKVVNDGSLDSERFSTAPVKSDSRDLDFIPLEIPGANKTFHHQPGLCPWHCQPPCSATPNLEKSFSSNTANIYRQPVSSFSKDLVSKLVQQNARLKMTMKRILGTKGLTITQFLDTQEQQDIINQLKQEIQRSRIRIQELVEDGKERKRKSSVDISIVDHDQR